MATPSFENVNDFLVTETGRIQSNMDRQSRARGYKWNSLVQRTPFPLGMGQTLSKVNYERTVPGDAFAWNQLTVNDGTGNNANVPSVQIDPASTNFSFSLYYGAINSNPMTIHDANLSLNFADQLNSTVYNLEGNVLDIWEDRKQDEYDRLCGHKVICSGNGNAPPESGTDQAWPNTNPTSQLTVEFLDECYDRLMRDGGSDGLDTVQGDPCPLVILEPEAKRDIFRNNTELSKNIRYSSDSDILLNPLGATMAYSNFKFVYNYRAPHWDFSGGTWTRRNFYSTSAATIGTKADPSLQYRNAQYATAYIFHPKVLELLVYDPDESYDNGVAFDASTWMGKFKWVNQKDNSVNIDGHTGYFRALLASASRPGLPNLGFALRYRRCQFDYNATACLGC